MRLNAYSLPSLLLALLGHVTHHLLLAFLGFFQFFLVHALHHLTHHQGETNHPHKRILQVNSGIERRPLLKVALSG